MSAFRQPEELPVGFARLGDLAAPKFGEARRLLIPLAARHALEARQTSLAFEAPAAAAAPVAPIRPASPPQRVVKTTNPGAFPPGPNDLGSINAESLTVLADIKALTARILTKHYLADLDLYSGKLCTELFVGASLRILRHTDYPSTWHEVLRYLDDTRPEWEAPKQIVQDLRIADYGVAYAFDGAMADFLLDMPEDSLSLLLRRCRLVLQRAIGASTTKAGARGGTAKRPSKSAAVSIFSPQAIQRALGTIGKMEEKVRSQAQQSLNAAASDDGNRVLPDIRKALANLSQLAADFENLAEPIEHLRTELALAGAMPPADFRLSPLLLLGEPGIGKTYLALQLANALGVPMDKLSAGAAQGGFQLTGSHPSWNRAMPGSVFTLLAEGSSATPVLVIDEVDKIVDGGSYPIIPALLDLLETNTARAFKDEFFDMPLDASRIIVVLTANDRDAVPAPLLSRVSLFMVPRPEEAQRLRIVRTEMASLQRKTRKRIELDIAAAEALAARTDIDLRQIRRLVVEAFAAALMNGTSVASPKVRAQAERRVVGFVR